jgi:hypothetical protein
MHLVEGDYQRAWQLAGNAARRSAEAFGLAHEIVRQAWPDALEAALATGDLTDAENLLGLVAQHPIGHIPPYLRAQWARYRARLAAARGRHAQVDADFSTAEMLLLELGYPYWAARTELDHAAWLTDQHHSDQARALLAQAVGTFERLDARPALALAQDLMSTLPAPAGVAVPDQPAASSSVGRS